MSVGKSNGFNLSHDGRHRHDDAAFLIKVLSHGGSHTSQSQVAGSTHKTGHHNVAGREQSKTTRETLWQRDRVL